MKTVKKVLWKLKEDFRKILKKIFSEFLGFFYGNCMQIMKKHFNIYRKILIKYLQFWGSSEKIFTSIGNVFFLISKKFQWLLNQFSDTYRQTGSPDNLYK